MMDCPCCGQKLLGDIPASALSAATDLRPVERRVVEALAQVYPKGLTRRQLADRVYANDPTGGPLSAERCIDVHLHYVRKKLSPLGWMAGRTGNRAGYLRLQRADHQPAP